jgi:hypothetical protein
MAVVMGAGPECQARLESPGDPHRRVGGMVLFRVTGALHTLPKVHKLSDWGGQRSVGLATALGTIGTCHRSGLSIRRHFE